MSMYNQTAVLPISKERAAYLQKQKRKKYMIRTIQISVVIILLAMWEILANIGVIDSFIMSQMCIRDRHGRPADGRTVSLCRQRCQ